MEQTHAGTGMNVRQSNFELLRIIAILLVLVLHADFFALQGPSAQDIISSPADSVLRIVFQSVSIMAVNIFVMISGWFGIRQSYRGFGNLLFQTFYYLILVYAVMLAGGWATFSGNGIKDLFMVNSSNWFIKAYILLYILAPVLNTFVEHCSRKNFSHVLCGFFIFQSLYGWLFPKSTEYIWGGIQQSHL